jgi:hypothetical protein
MYVLSEAHFHNEAAAIERLEAIVWPKGPFCPRCGGFARQAQLRFANDNTSETTGDVQETEDNSA